MRVVRSLKRALRGVGVDVRRYNSYTNLGLRRSGILRSRAVDTVLDVGANIGSFPAELREFGYSGSVVSFEPRKAAFERLVRAARGDSRWKCYNVAVGDFDGTTLINVSGHESSSSLLRMTDAHVSQVPGSGIRDTEEVAVVRLETFLKPLLRGNERIWLKLDVQGYEYNALLGLGELINCVVGVETELSYQCLYQGSLAAREMIQYLGDKGFSLEALTPVLLDKDTLRLVQADGLFLRRRNGE